jgi:hypothetical protein
MNYDNFVDHVMINMIYQFGVFLCCNKKVIGIAMARETITRDYQGCWTLGIKGLY